MSRVELDLSGVKIARVSTVAFFVETQLKAQLESIVEAGADLTVVASEEKLAFELSGMRYASIYIPRKIDLLRDLKALWKLFFYFRRERFDIVHSTTPKAGLLCSVAAYFAGVPIRLHTFTGQPWVELRGVKFWLSKYSDWLIAKINTYCYADSQSQLNFIVESGVTNESSIGVVGKGSLAGIDLDRFRPDRFSADECAAKRQEMGIADNALVLLFVGRLNPDKGIAELLAAYDSLVKKGFLVNLILLGPLDAGDQAFIDGLPAQGRSGVVVQGFSPEPERFMAIADILILPSYREGFGTVVLEAAAMGVPAIGTNIYGLCDAIEQGSTGLLVPVRDSAALTLAIESLVLDVDMRRKMGEAALQRARESFSSKLISNLLIDQYICWLEQSRIKKGGKG